VVRDDYHAELAERFGAGRVVRISRGERMAARYDRIIAGIGARRVPGRCGQNAVQGGFDVSYDCVGSGQTLSDAFKLTRARGTTVVMSTPQICVADMTPTWFAELNVIGATGRQIEEYQGRRAHTFEIVLDWLRSGRLRLEGLLTHCLPLGEYRKAFRLLTDRREPVVKVAFDHRGVA
jgi:L-iditol 2-dehydrogenase